MTSAPGPPWWWVTLLSNPGTVQPLCQYERVAQDETSGSRADEFLTDSWSLEKRLRGGIDREVVLAMRRIRHPTEE